MKNIFTTTFWLLTVQILFHFQFALGARLLLQENNFFNALQIILPPIVQVISPMQDTYFLTGSQVQIAANVSDPNPGGAVVSVEFLVDSFSTAIKKTPPYFFKYAFGKGKHTIRVKAINAAGYFNISYPVTIYFTDTLPPTINLTSSTHHSLAGEVVFLQAAVADANLKGLVNAVEFFADGISIGIKKALPFSMEYYPLAGVHVITATATNNFYLKTLSRAETIKVVNDTPPTIEILSPGKLSLFAAPEIVPINVLAKDSDGTIASVEFFINNVSKWVSNAPPFTYNWPSTIGQAILSAKATDNKGNVTTSASILLSIANAASLPYTVNTLYLANQPGSFCLPLAAIDTIKNCIGFDVEMQYNKQKLLPTGKVSIYNDLVNSKFVDVVTQVDTARATIKISSYFNPAAPSNYSFKGIGKLFCVEFNKKQQFKTVDTAAVSVSFFQESYFTGIERKLVHSGAIITRFDSLNNVHHTNGISDNLQLEPYRFFPNPVTDWLHIVVPGKALVQLYDILGNLLVSEQATSEAQLNINAWPFKTGVYTLKIYHEDHISTEKIFISK